MTKRPRRMDTDVADAIAYDLPDGAYFAMMEEMTGLEPADLVQDEERRPSPSKRRFVCPICHRRFHGRGALRQHTRDKHTQEKQDG